jgi:hypothetical protein
LQAPCAVFDQEIAMNTSNTSTIKSWRDALPARSAAELTDNDIPLSNSLADLRERLKAEHAAVIGALRNSLNRAMAAGDILLEAKLQLKHGQWLPWLETCDISERTAQRYMRLARNRPEIESNPTPVSDLGVKGALTLLCAPRDPLAYQVADSAIETAFDSELCEVLEEIDRHGKQRRALLDEAKVAIVDKIGRLLDRQPALVPVVESCIEIDQLYAATNEYMAKCLEGTYSIDDIYSRNKSLMALAINIRDLANTFLAKVEAGGTAAAIAEQAP